MTFATWTKNNFSDSEDNLIPILTLDPQWSQIPNHTHCAALGNGRKENTIIHDLDLEDLTCFSDFRMATAA